MAWSCHHFWSSGSRVTEFARCEKDVEGRSTDVRYGPSGPSFLPPSFFPFGAGFSARRRVGTRARCEACAGTTPRDTLSPCAHAANHASATLWRVRKATMRFAIFGNLS